MRVATIVTTFRFDKGYLLRYCGWSVEGFPLRRHPDKKAILDEAEGLINNPDLLVERITKAPSIMDTDNGVTIALYLLRAYADAPKCESSTQAAKILHAIGRRDLLPKTPDGKAITNRTPDKWIYFWEYYDPEYLIDTVNEYREKLLRLFGDCPENHKRRRNPPNKLFTPGGGTPVYECCLEHAFRAEFNEDIPEGFSKLGSPVLDNLGLMALRFVSHKKKTPFNPLYRLYHHVAKKGKLRPYWGMSPAEALEQAREEKLDRESGLEFFPLDSDESEEKK